MREILILLVAQILLAVPGVAKIAEQPVSNVIYGSAPGFRDYPQIASDGQNFLVLWHDERALPAVMYPARVNREGQMLDPTCIRTPLFHNPPPALLLPPDSFFMLW